MAYQRSAEMQKAFDDLDARPCHCVSCDECRGTGNVWYSFGGISRGTYLGSHRRDDLDEMETCDVCGGYGIVERSERCCELQELEEAEQEAEESAFRLEPRP